MAATWLITGCSSGLGRALASAVLEHDDNVVVTARDPTSIADLTRAHPTAALALALDVTRDEQRRAVVRAALDRFGGVDVLVNNAGHGYRAALEEASDDQVQAMFATNFFGPVGLMQAVLPSMRERRSGAIVNISSGGARSFPLGAGHYVATKAALEAASWSLAREVAPLGITVIVVEPGAFRTQYKRSLHHAREPISAYADTVGARRAEDLGEHGLQPGDPDRAAQAIIAAVESTDPPPLLVLGPDALVWYRSSVQRLDATVDAWEQVSLGTSFVGEEVGA